MAERAVRRLTGGTPRADCRKGWDMNGKSDRQTAGGVFAPLCAFFRNVRGVAAIEFALIVPLLLTLYFVTMEVGQAIQTNKKVGRAASMIADLITQQPEMTPDQIDAIIKIGSAILQPYTRSQPDITVTAIQVTDESTPKVLVAWSRQFKDGRYGPGAPPGSKASVPAKLKKRGTFLVHVETDLEYEPVITWTASQKQALGLFGAFDGISMGEGYYLRPRMSTDIPCDAC